MNVLIGCEESGKVRDEFLALGHNAFSNDIIQARNGGPHLQMCVTKAIDYMDWDIIILHPDCTAVCVAGNRHYAGTEARANQVEWIISLWKQAKQKAKIGVALENPASVIWPKLRPIADMVQFIQPWQFGHKEQKKTGLALDRLPPLKEVQNVYSEMMKLPIHIRERIWSMGPSETRKRDRSETYSGIAKAMANQWGSL